MYGRTRDGPDPGVLLRVAEHFLGRREFADCRQYAQQAYQIEPNFPGVSEILAVANVLLASDSPILAGTLPDWYAVLQLNRHTRDSNVIKQRFNHLHPLLNPINNKFPFADEAFGLVRDAWCVLSNPVKKSEFDEILKKHIDDEKSKANCSFEVWTLCPYCYYVYEYPRVYLECCLRCPNEKCAKAFTCVEIARPPMEVLRQGKYMCAGFLPVGFQEGNWNPFSPLEKQKGTASNDNDTTDFVEISDDDDFVVETATDNCCNVSGDGVESAKMDMAPSTIKPVVTRQKKKSVAKTTKKLTGTGNRVIEQGFISQNSNNDDYEDDFSSLFVGGRGDFMNGGEIEFYDADDDILVSLKNDP